MFINIDDIKSTCFMPIPVMNVDRVIDEELIRY